MPQNIVKKLLIGLLIAGGAMLMAGVGVAEYMICTNSANVCVTIGTNLADAMREIQMVGGPGVGLAETGTGFLGADGVLFVFYKLMLNSRNEN